MCPALIRLKPPFVNVWLINDHYCSVYFLRHEFGECQNDRRQQGAGVKPAGMYLQRVIQVFAKSMPQTDA